MDLSVPIAAHIALASILLRYKPAESSIEEYIHDLREIIVDKTRKLSVDSQQHIDGTLFWKRAYEKSEMEKMELQRKIFDLEQQLLRSQNANSSPTPPFRQATKQLEVQQIPRANTQTKRKKLSSPIALTADKELSFQLEEADPKLGCHLILRAIYGLQQTAKSPKIEAEAICQHIRLYSHYAAQVIKQACCKSITNNPSIEFDLEPVEVCKIIRKTLPVVLENLRILQTCDAEQEVAICTSHLVHLFETMLGQLQQISLDEADRATQKQKRKRARNNQPMNVQDGEAANAQQISKAIAMTMACIFDVPESSKQQCSKLQQALICVLLDHIGSALSLAVFGDPAMDKSKDKGVMAPQGLLDVGHIDTKTALLTVQLAAPFLVYVLSRALTTINQDPMLNSLKPSNNDVGGGIFVSIKDKLQHTLLRGIFGDEDETFQEAFERAEKIGNIEIQELLEVTRQDRDSPEWFIGQVWECLGWDILAVED